MTPCDVCLEPVCDWEPYPEDPTELRLSDLITVLIVDEHARHRAVLRAVLEADGRYVVVGEGTGASDTHHLLLELQPQVVVVDHAVPLASGLPSVPDLRRTWPDAAFVMWTSTVDAHHRPVELGADSYVDKGGPLHELLDVLAELVA